MNGKNAVMTIRYGGFMLSSGYLQVRNLESDGGTVVTKSGGLFFVDENPVALVVSELTKLSSTEIRLAIYEYHDLDHLNEVIVLANSTVLLHKFPIRSPLIAYNVSCKSTGLYYRYPSIYSEVISSRSVLSNFSYEKVTVSTLQPYEEATLFLEESFLIPNHVLEKHLYTLPVVLTNGSVQCL